MSKKIHLLLAETDRAALQPILDALQEKGLRVKESRSAKKGDIVLAALSDSFYANADITDRLLNLLASGAENVLPLQLDGTPIPDTLKNALYARNIIPSAGRGAAHTAERIIDALPKKKSRLPLILSVAGILLLAVVGLWFWRSTQSGEVVPAMAEEDIPIPASLGLTAEDLAAIEDVVIVADQVAFFTDEDFRELGTWPDENHFTYLDEWVPDGENVHWYSKEDGHEYQMTRYDDLRFLGLMPNLRYLTMVLVEADEAELPNLQEAALLQGVQILSCEIHGIGWLSGSSIESLSVRFSPVEDFSVLTACSKLDALQVDMYRLPIQTDFSGFAPPALSWLWLWHANPGGSLDLPALGGCLQLREVIFGDLPLTDLSCLSGAEALETLHLYEMQGLRDLSGLGEQPIDDLRIENAFSLRDISAIGDLKQLRDLYIGYCPRITDYTPIVGCAALERIHVQGDENPDALRDASFLAALEKLRDIGLYSCNLYNMDFLEGIAEQQDSINLGFAGDILDYSGLAAIHNYDYLHVNPRYQNGSRGGDFSAVLPYIQDAKIDSLMLYSCAGVDLSALPDGIGDLSIRYGDLSDLSGLKPYALRRLELWDCQYLTSLNGIEAIPTLFGNRGQAELSIVGCPRLTDYTALEGGYLETLKLTGVYTLPEMTAFRKTNNLFLESIDGLSDLNCLHDLNGGDGCNLSLVGLDDLYDLTPLRSLSGDHLTVPPQVAEQAQELVEAGIYRDYEIAYPDGSWQPFDGQVELMSLDELETLPRSLLRRVERLAIAGDRLIDPDRYDIREDWSAADWESEDPQPGLVLCDRETGEETPLEMGSVTELSRFSALTGLRELLLYAQPLETLDGVQAMSELVRLELVLCPSLTDASAAFALPELNNLHLRNSAVTSIQGVQNLSHLQLLDCFHTKVTDLSPLNACDFAEAYENGGLQLDLADLPCEDFSPLGSIREFSFLCLNNMGSDLWADALAGSTLHRFGATSAGWTNESFARFVGQHPELEELEISWSMELTDLTPLLSLENLTLLHLNRQMEEAIDSLSGHELRFELWIDD